MSLEIFPTYPKIRADQIEGDWSSVRELITIIEKTANSAVNDENVAAVINTGAQTQAAINNLIRAQVNQSFLDPLVAGLVNDGTSQTRAILDTIINNAIASAFNYRGQVNGPDVNWNELTEPGYYLITLEGEGRGSNFPPVFVQGGVLFVLTSKSGGINQLFLGQYGALAYRFYDGIEWRPWFGRSGTEMSHGYPYEGVDLDTQTYRPLVTFRPSEFLWPGSSGVVIVRVFGQLLYVTEWPSSSVSYIRLRQSSSSSGLAIVKAERPGVYPLISPLVTMSTSEDLIIEARSSYFNPGNPPKLAAIEEDTLATRFIFTF